MTMLNTDLDYNDSPLLPFDRSSEPGAGNEGENMLENDLVIGRSFDIRHYADDVSDEQGSGELSTLNKLGTAAQRASRK